MTQSLDPSNTYIVLCTLQSTSEAVLEHYVNELDENERERYQRYRFVEDKQRFVIGRGLLRHSLQLLYPERANGRWCIHSDAKGKPYIDENTHISITHSGHWVGVALSPVTIGIDIEKRKRKQAFESIAKQYFTPKENQTLVSHQDKPSLFFTLWTLKEAYLKAEGTGISAGLDSIEFDVSSQTMKRSILSGTNENIDSAKDSTKSSKENSTKKSDQKEQWQCISSALDSEHALALAIKGLDNKPEFLIASNSHFSTLELNDPLVFTEAI